MKPVKLGTIAIIALVALRIGAGWLFYREGSKKVDSGTFTSRHFLADAKGPFKYAFQGMIPDGQGIVRLDEDLTIERWEQYRQRATSHFDFDKKQQAHGAAALKKAQAQLDYFMAANYEDLEKFFNQEERLRADQESGATRNVNFRSNWQETEQKKLKRQLQGWLAQIDEIWNRYEQDINAIPEDDQYNSAGYLYLERPGTGMFSSDFADAFMPWFTFIVGVLLVLGLFTRVAALGGAGFLLMVISTQPPWVPSAADVNYQIVLMLSLLVVAAIGAGRWGGLDFFLGLCCNKCCGWGKSTDTATTNEENKS